MVVLLLFIKQLPFDLRTLRGFLKQKAAMPVDSVDGIDSDNCTSFPEVVTL